MWGDRVFKFNFETMRCVGLADEHMLGFACYDVVRIKEFIADIEHRGIVENEAESELWLAGLQPHDLVDVWRTPEAPRYALTLEVRLAA